MNGMLILQETKEKKSAAFLINKQKKILIPTQKTKFINDNVSKPSTTDFTTALHRKTHPQKSLFCAHLARVFEYIIIKIITN